MEKFNKLFSFQGKSGRREYFYIMLGLGILQVVLYLIPPIGESIIFFISLIVIYPWLIFSAIVRRLRDIGKEPWLFLLLFIPLIGVFLAFMLLFQQGVDAPSTIGDNSKFCGHCGIELKAGAKFCTSCGRELKIDKVNQSLF